MDDEREVGAMKTYRVGVFGIGWVAGEHIKAYGQNPRMKVAALASRHRESAQAAREKLAPDCDVAGTFDDLVRRDDLDVIDICSPNVFHAEEAVAAAEAGKHVVIEKPVAMNLRDLRAVRDAVVKAKVKSQVGFVLRWNPHIQTIRGMIDKGGLGDLYYTEVDYFHEIGPWWSGWRWGAATRQGGPSATLMAGCHAVDLLRYFGGEVEEVFAYGTFGHRRDYEYEPTYAAVVKFRSGKIGKTGCSFENECPYILNLLLHGTRGSVLNEKFFAKDWFPGQKGWQQFNTTFADSGDVAHHPFQGMVDDLASALAEDREATANIHEAYQSHELCLAIDRSIATGQAVKLPLTE
jgi:predicted dehydrogenase